MEEINQSLCNVDGEVFAYVLIDPDIDIGDRRLRHIDNIERSEDDVLAHVSSIDCLIQIDRYHQGFIVLHPGE